jgi:hypothetical protein
MSTQRLYAFEHAGTLIRAAEQGGVVQLIRDGKLIAKYGCHQNYQLSLGGSTLAWATGQCYLAGIDLAAPFPQEPRRLADGKIIHPHGGRAVDWLYVEDPSAPSELFSTDLQEGDRRTIWKGFTTSPKPIDLQRRGQLPIADTTHLQFGEVLFADDGETWVVLEKDRAEIGRGGERTASICWSAGYGSINWWPTKSTFDLSRKRLLLSGKPGVSAISFDGEVVAYGNPGHCVSAPCFYRDELVVVVQKQPFGMSDYVVVRLDPETLAPRGMLEEIGMRNEMASQQALLALGDGSLAWIPRVAPIRILPAPGTGWRASSVIEIAGQARVSSLPPARPKQKKRELEARELLEELSDRTEIDRLFSFDLGAFQPWADGILAWDDDRLSRLQTLDRHTWWQLARGASDGAVDRFAERARGDQLMLLIGVDTDRSRAKLGELARKDAEVRELCRENLLAIPKKGPALRRFSPVRREIVPARTAARGLSSSAKVLSEGWSYRMPPYTLLSVSLDLVPLKSPLKSQHFLLSGCEDCREWQLSYTLEGRGKKVDLIAADGGKRRSKDRCGGPRRWTVKIGKFKLEKPREKYRKRAGVIGGWPNWWQSPEPPDCARCGELMFFVGEVYASNIAEVRDNALYGFHCEKCGVTTNIVQFT